MAAFSRDEPLQRVPDVALHLDATGTVQVEVGGGRVQLGRAGLELLQALTVPRTAEDVLSGESGGPQAWIDRSATLVQLVELGLVLPVGAARSTQAPASSYTFDAQYTHVRMLDDVQRTAAFRAAIARAVRPGDVVVDIGTGTGVLAVAAAQAGAARVYAIEAGAVADMAEAVFAANGVADRVTLLRGWSTEVDLPERVDVVVSETIGSEPLDERILEVMRDARERFARPGARYVPQRLHVFATPVEVGRTSVTFTPDAVRRWGQQYETDFGPLLRWRGRVAQTKFRRKDVRGWRPLGPAVELADLRLDAVEALAVDVRVDLPVRTAGSFEGAFLHFVAELAPGVVLDGAPEAAEDSSWMHTAVLVPPRPVAVGDAIGVEYRYRAGGEDGLSVLEVDPNG